MPIEVYLNVAVSGVLTGLVYGLMALGLSVIFGVVRVVNFAHGEMMTVAMYAATTLFAALGLDPFAASCWSGRGGVLRLRLRAAGGADQPVHHSPRALRSSCCWSAVAIIMVNGAADGVRPRRAQRAGRLRSSKSFEIGPQILRRHKAVCRRTPRSRRLRPLFFFFRISMTRQSDPRLRRQPPRRAGGRPERRSSSTRSPSGSAAVCVARCWLRDGAARSTSRRRSGRPTPCSPSSSSSSAASARCPARCSAAC